MEEEIKKTKEVKTMFELAEVATQTTVVIKNNVTGEVMNEAQALALILNELYLIKKATV